MAIVFCLSYAVVRQGLIGGPVLNFPLCWARISILKKDLERIELQLDIDASLSAVNSGRIFSGGSLLRYAGAMSEHVSDEELMMRYCDGDAAAFESLYTKYKGGIYRYLLRQTDSQVAAELHQEVWMNLVRHHKNYQPRARFSTYLYTIAHNRVIDHYRGKARRLPVSYAEDIQETEPAAPTRYDPAARYQLSIQVEHVLAGIAKLPEAQREAFLLREEAGLSLEEIATVTGTSRETVKSRLRYAVNKLRQTLSEPEHVR